jgi:hypothetical protein
MAEKKLKDKLRKWIALLGKDGIGSKQIVREEMIEVLNEGGKHGN